MKIQHLLLLTVTALGLPACATKREVPFRISPSSPVTGKMARYDYSNYAPIPDTPTSGIYRVVLKTIPYTREHAFYGRWAGSGCAGGPPVDAMDEVFRRHDIVYGESKSLRTMKWADAACVEALEKLDPRNLTPEAIAFRDRSASFFANPRFTLVGKPVSSYFIPSEPKGSPFQCENDVREVFGLEKISSPAAEPQSQQKPHAGRRMMASVKPQKPQKSHSAPPLVRSCAGSWHITPPGHDRTRSGSEPSGRPQREDRPRIGTGEITVKNVAPCAPNPGLPHEQCPRPQ